MKTIAEDTPILPVIIASNVVAEVGFLNLRHLDNQTAERLAARAERHYKGDGGTQFARKIRSASGRDYLYAFMRHWLAAMLLEAGCPREQLPTEWKA